MVDVVTIYMIGNEKCKRDTRRSGAEAIVFTDMCIIYIYIYQRMNCMKNHRSVGGYCYCCPITIIDVVAAAKKRTTATTSTKL